MMMELLVEAVVISFTLGGVVGAIVTMHLSSERKEKQAAKDRDEVLE